MYIIKKKYETFTINNYVHDTNKNVINSFNPKNVTFKIAVILMSY